MTGTEQRRAATADDPFTDDAFAARQGLFRSSAHSLSRLLALTFFDRRASATSQAPLRTILLVRWDGKLGDSIVSSFVMREAHRLGARVIVATTARLAHLYSDHFGADVVVQVPKNPSLVSRLRIAQELRCVDTVIYMTKRLSANDIVFLWALNPSRVFSMDHRPLWVTGIPLDDVSSFRIVDEYVAVLNQLGLHSVDSTPIIPAPTASPVSADVIFNPFGSRRDKSMSVARASTTLRKIAACYPTLRIAVLSHDETQDEATLMCAESGAPNVQICRTSNGIDSMIETLWAASLIVSVDTSVVHIASGMRKPLVAIFPLIGERMTNPWLPPTQPCTQIVYSLLDGRLHAKTGLKSLDNFDDAKFVDALNLVYPLEADSQRASGYMDMPHDAGNVFDPRRRALNK